MAIRWNHLSTTCSLPGTRGRNESSHQQHFLAPPRRAKPHRPQRPNAVPSNNVRQLIESGAIRPIPPTEAASAVMDGYVMLDIRPEWEREKARVAGSLHVPLFVEDRDNGPLTLLKKWVHFGYIGLWTGQNFTTLNSDFIGQVEGKLPDKDARILIACGEGLRWKSGPLIRLSERDAYRTLSRGWLRMADPRMQQYHLLLLLHRSMMAASKLYDHGYRNLGWLAGGFNRSKDSDFPDVEGAEKLQYATIGGASYFFLQLLILLQAVGKE